MHTAHAYGAGTATVGNPLPLLWRESARPSRFGDLAIVLFLLAQSLDGAFTYVGVATFGERIEANPLLLMLMREMGTGPALLVAKVVAGTLGIALHLLGVHRAVALLSAFYFGAAVLPWAAILIWS